MLPIKSALSLAKQINFTAFFFLVVYPLIIVALFVSNFYTQPIGWFEVTLFITSYYMANISVGLGLHRLWSHDSYKTNKFVEFVLALFSAGTLQGPALSWASNHMDHHRFVDTKDDPHTPLKFSNPIKGFLWAHIGWMIIGKGSNRGVSRIAMVKLGRNKVLRWQMHNYWKIAMFMNFVMPMIYGVMLNYFVFGTHLSAISAAYTGFLCVGLARALQQHVTFCVNSLCHFIGTKTYSKGTEGDIGWMFFLLLGENYHNFHHAFPNDYRNGIKWYHGDVHKWLIYLMSKVGLAWDLKITEPVRVNAKVESTKEYFKQYKIEQIFSLHSKVDSLICDLQKKFSEYEAQSVDFYDNLDIKYVSSHFNNYYKRAEAKLNNILVQLKAYSPSEGVKNAGGVKKVSEINKKLLEYFANQVLQAEIFVKDFAAEVEKLKAFS